MIQNFTAKQILLIILVIVLILWFLSWIFGWGKSNPQMPIQPVAQQPQMMAQPPMLQPGQMMQSSQPITTPVGPEQQNTPYTLYYFHSPRCSACQNFNHVWEQISNRLKRMNGIFIHKVDVTRPENENLTFYYNVSQLPTIILVTPDRNIEYNGDRSPEDLHKFIVSNINQYNDQY